MANLFEVFKLFIKISRRI